ncbi:MAG: vanomycin resistance protein VanB [Chloroflexi bacterium]|nr:vanomycin resistance protein VanB [Chloroflexota bacterium]
MPERYINKYGPIDRRRRGYTPPQNQKPGNIENVVIGVPKAPEPGTATIMLPTITQPSIWIGLIVVVLAFITPYVFPASERAVDIGVTLQGQTMEGMTREMLDEAVATRYEAFLARPVTLVYKERVWNPSASDLGVSLNIRQTSNELLGLTTDVNLERWIRNWWARRQGVLDVGPHLVINGARMQQYLMTISSQVDQPVRPADLLIDPQTGATMTVAAQTGRQILVDETMVDIYNALAATTPMTVTLRSREIAPRVDAAVLDKSAKDVERFLGKPLVVRHGTSEWVWERDRLASLIISEKDANGVTQVRLNAQAIALEVDRVAQRVDSPSVEPRVRWRDGTTEILVPGKRGVRLDRVAAVQAIGDALYGTTREIDLPTIAVEPQLNDAAVRALTFVDVLSTGRSSFVGSADYRITNIKAGVARINGVLIAPGAEFSFNTEVGEINEANGFAQGYAVIGNRTQLEWGGGVCQVSTSLFRAAFYAGLPFKEWHAHPFYISWYDAYAFPDTNGPGLDAAIFTGELDLRFVNDTAHWMLVDATIDEQQQILDIQLRGVTTGRSVTVNGPTIVGTTPAPKDPVYVDDPTLPTGTVTQSDKAKEGKNVVVYRTINKDGKTLPMEEFATTFKPWPDVYLRGTGPKETTP